MSVHPRPLARTALENLPDPGEWLRSDDAQELPAGLNVRQFDIASYFAYRP